MDIEFPGSLQWVAPVAGSAWPGHPASESALLRVAEALRAAGGGLGRLVPELGRVRATTRAVLAGQTAQAADAQFALLFDGEAAVDKLGAALGRLADLAEQMSTAIQYTKLQILATLAVTAGSIGWALANAEWSMGATLAQIPAIELAAEQTIGRLVTAVVQRIAAALTSALSKTMVKRLLVEAAVSAGIGAAQELGIEGLQVLDGHRAGIDAGQVVGAGLSMGEAGAAGAVAGGVTGQLLGEGGSTAARAAKGAAIGLASAEAANIAATLGGGGHLTTATLLGGALGIVHGGLHGATRGGHGITGDAGVGEGFGDEPAAVAAPANAVGAHPTLRFEKQPDGTFAWPGERTVTVQDPSASPDVGTPPTHRSSPLVPAVDSGARIGERSTGSPHAAPTARSEGATGSPGGSDAVAASVDSAPVAPDTATSPPGHPSADGEVAAGTHGGAGPGLPEGALALALPAPPAAVESLADARGLAAADVVGAPGTVGSPAAVPDGPRAGALDPPSAPRASSDRGPSAPSPRLTPDPRTGLAESACAAGESDALQAGAPAARSSAAITAHTDSSILGGDREGVQTAQADGNIAQPPAQPISPDPIPAEQSGRSGVDAHLLDRRGGVRSDSRRTADPPTTRRDPARPDSTRDDRNRPTGARPGKLHRSNHGRDIPDDLQHATTTRGTPHPFAAAENTGIIKAHHEPSRPNPGEPEAHNGGGAGRDEHTTAHPGAASAGPGLRRGGDGGSRGGAGGHRGGVGGGTSDDGVRPSDGGRSHDPAAARATGGSDEGYPVEEAGEGASTRSRGQDGPTSAAQNAASRSGPTDYTNPDADKGEKPGSQVGPAVGDRKDPEPPKTSHEYRALDPALREANPSLAEDLGEVVSSLDEGRASNLADNYSGKYGPFLILLKGEVKGGKVRLFGEISIDGLKVGYIERHFYRDGAGLLVADHDWLRIDDERFRGKGLSKAVYDRWGREYDRSGFDRTELLAVGDGAYAWARRGFTWKPDTQRQPWYLSFIRASAEQLTRQISDEARDVLDGVVVRLHPDHAELPTPVELANLATRNEPNLGRELLYNTGWRLTWEHDPQRLIGNWQQTLRSQLSEIKASAEELGPRISDEGRNVLAGVVARLHPDHPELPEPIDLANLATPNEPDLGRRLLEQTYWAFAWNPNRYPALLQFRLDEVKAWANKLAWQISDEGRDILDGAVARLHPDHPELPEPIDLANLATPNEPDLGRRLLVGTKWDAVSYRPGYAA